MASEVVNDLSLVEARETQIEDAHAEETYAEEIQVHETLTHAEEAHAEETRVQVEARETQIEARAEEIQVQIPNHVESQIDDANGEETRLQIPSPATPVSLIPSPSTPVSRKKKAEDEPFSPWKLRKLSSTPQIQVTSSLNHKSKPIATNPNATTQNHHWGQKYALADSNFE